MVYILLLVAVILAAYFVIRFYMLKNSFKEIENELQEIQQDVTQNQILHLPFPDCDLEILLRSINCTLDEIREERKRYAQRESEFQSQIEAISHDLRTPLTVILGYIKLLQTQVDSSVANEQKEMLDTIERKARTMENLISQFYDYSRLSASDYDLELEEVDARKILRETFIDNCLVLETANLEVRTDFPDCPIWVAGNKAALERIFSNLLQNAGRYACTFVNLEIKSNEQETHIIFENDTQELSASDIPYLFERFYMKDNSRNQDGTGLGLTIAKYLAKEMNGELNAEIIESQNPALLLLRFTLCLKSSRYPRKRNLDK